MTTAPTPPPWVAYSWMPFNDMVEKLGVKPNDRGAYLINVPETFIVPSPAGKVELLSYTVEKQDRGCRFVPLPNANGEYPRESTLGTLLYEKGLTATGYFSSENDPDRGIAVQALMEGQEAFKAFLAARGS